MVARITSPISNIEYNFMYNILSKVYKKCEENLTMVAKIFASIHLKLNFVFRIRQSDFFLFFTFRRRFDCFTPTLITGRRVKSV